MTVNQKIKGLVHSQEVSMEADTWQKLVYLAYYIGREEGTRQCADQYNALIKAQRERANACRYSHMANAVVGLADYLYNGDYAQDMKHTFGGDATAL